MTNYLRFDGVNDYVAIPATPDMAGDWQMEMKVTILKDATTQVLGRTTSGRGIDLRVANDQVRVQGTTGTAYDIACPLALGETCTILIVRTVSPSRITVFKNGIQTGQITFSQGLDAFTFIGRAVSSYANFDVYYLRLWDAANDILYSANGITSGTVLPQLNNSASNGTLVNFTGTPWLDDSLINLPASVTPGQPHASTSIAPFVDGVAVATFTDHSVPVVIAGGAFTFPVPALADGKTWPRLPAASGTFTLTQGATTFSLFRPVNLPVGFQTLRDASNNPANFENINSEDQTYIPYWFALAVNSLTTGDTMYWDATSGLWFDRDGRPSLPVDSAPLTTDIIIHRASGKVYLHQVTFSAAGIISGGEFGFKATPIVAKYFQKSRIKAISF